MNTRHAAPLIFTLEGPPISNGWLESDEYGTIVSVNEGPAPADCHMHEGILVPGLINAHCHLELSHLRGKISRKNGMTAFLRELFAIRFSSTEDEVVKAMQEADKEMSAGGIVAVGDISNFGTSFSVKESSSLQYHTFVEILGLNPSKATEIIQSGNNLHQLFNSGKHSATLAPHAPYSLSDELFDLLKQREDNSPSTIHVEESMDEHAYCTQKKGAMAELFTSMGIDYSTFKPTPQQTPLQRVLDRISNQRPFLFVHNTLLEQNEFDQINNRQGMYWCLCPNANLYITDRLPDLSIFRKLVDDVVIGTDSLASNDSLSILSELTTLSKADSLLSFEQLLRWATLNGAKALQLEDHLGSIKPGKKPGVVLLKGMNANAPVFNQDVRPIRIV